MTLSTVTDLDVDDTIMSAQNDGSGVAVSKVVSISGNFRINDLISKLSDKKYEIEIISSNVYYVSKTNSNTKIKEY